MLLGVASVVLMNLWRACRSSGILQRHQAQKPYFHQNQASDLSSQARRRISPPPCIATEAYYEKKKPPSREARGCKFRSRHLNISSPVLN
jgi:hypothetical protein